MAAMTGKKKGLLIAAAVLLVIVGVFCGILFGTELIQQKVIELMCPDTPSSTPRDYDAITAGTSLKTVEYASGQQADVIAPKEGASSNIVVVYFHGGAIMSAEAGTIKSLIADILRPTDILC